MKILALHFLLILSFFLLTANCRAQNNPGDRQPAVAGQFYPSSKNELQAMLEQLFSHAVPSKNIKNVLAIISPHAGYVYSGEVAASGFNQINPAMEYENIFIIASSHHVGFEGASIYSKGNFITPLGTAKVNTELAKKLIQKSDVFSSRTDAHVPEHSVEVEIPFLQYRMKKDLKIVPIVIGAGTSPETCKKIAEALGPYLTSKNLFIISTDLSHYPSYEDAKTVDNATVKAVLSNSPANLITAIDNNSRKDIPNLATSMCGLTGVLTLLYMTEKNPDISYTLIQYKNSGDAEFGDKSRVVGYASIAVSLKDKKENMQFNLNEKDKKDLLTIARKTIEQYVTKHEIPKTDTAALSNNVKSNCGAFVTLNKYGSLRGCIGRFDADEPLYTVVQQMAIAAATQDYRFPQVRPEEVDTLDIEISVLTPMRKINSIDEIEMGRHGIYIKKGMHSGTFLPQVATETGWSKEEFLGHCSQDKAGIGWDGWKDADIFVYEAKVFGEKESNK